MCTASVCLQAARRSGQCWTVFNGRLTTDGQAGDDFS